MSATGHLRGHKIEFVDDEWIYSDTRESTVANWRDRPCGYCGMRVAEAGHDPCIENLPGVANACCGHGNSEESYIQFDDGSTVKGQMARRLQQAMVRLASKHAQTRRNGRQ